MFMVKPITGPAFAFSGIKANQSVAAAAHIIQSLCPDSNFPQVRSDPVQVIREDPAITAPMHVADVPFELILLNCDVNAPWQFTYQFGHELTHLLARSDLRFSRNGRHSWIEEALCGAGSIYALRRMAIDGGPDLEANAQDYLKNHVGFEYSAIDVTPEWFAANSASIFSSTNETAETARVAAAILDACPDGSFVYANRALIEVPLNPDLNEYLASWEKLVPASGREVPSLLRSLAFP